MKMKRTISSLYLLLLISTVALAQTLPDGVYYIRLASNPQYVIDVDHSRTVNGTNIHLWAFNGSNAQKWNLRNQPNGAITLRSLCGSSSVIDLDHGRVVNGQNIHLWTFRSGINQYWIPTRVKEGIVIRSAVNKKYVIDNYYARAVNGNNIVLHEFNGSNAQVWKFQRIGPPVTNTPPPSHTTTPPSQPVVTTPPPTPPTATPPRTRKVRVVTGRCARCCGTGLILDWYRVMTVAKPPHKCRESKHFLQCHDVLFPLCDNPTCPGDCGEPMCNACGRRHCTDYNKHEQCDFPGCERGDIVEYRDEPY